MIRINRINKYPDRMRNYKVVLDNNCLGEVGGGETKIFEVAQGKHTIYLKIDWCRSNKLDFYVSENEVLEFDCGSSISGWKILLNIIYIIFLKDNYLWIKMKKKVS